MTLVLSPWHNTTLLRHAYEHIERKIKQLFGSYSLVTLFQETYSLTICVEFSIPEQEAYCVLLGSYLTRCLELDAGYSNIHTIGIPLFNL